MGIAKPHVALVHPEGLDVPLGDQGKVIACRRYRATQIWRSIPVFPRKGLSLGLACST